MSNGVSAGGVSIRSRTSLAYSGDKDEMTWWNLASWFLIPLVANKDST